MHIRTACLFVVDEIKKKKKEERVSESVEVLLGIYEHGESFTDSTNFSTLPSINPNLQGLTRNIYLDH